MARAVESIFDQMSSESEISMLSGYIDELVRSFPFLFSLDLDFLERPELVIEYCLVLCSSLRVVAAYSQVSSEVVWLRSAAAVDSRVDFVSMMASSMGALFVSGIAAWLPICSR